MLTTRIDRSKRQLLKCAAYGLYLGALGLPLAWHSNLSAGLKNSLEPDGLLPSNLEAIGKEYLKQYPAEGTATTLLDAIQSRIGSFDMDPGNLPWAKLKQLIKDDFRTDEVVYLDGWALSRTEARLAALSVV